MNVESAPVESLVPNPRNFFKPPTEEEIAELAASVAELGIIHPIVGRKLPDGRYEIISGHRRTAAARLAGLKEVPVAVINADDCEAELMLIDANVETRQLSPMEIAKAIRRKKELMGERRGRPELENKNRAKTATISSGRTRDLIAAQFGLKGRQVSDYDSLNDLIPELQSLIEDGRLGVTAGSQLARLSPQLQKELYDKMGNEIACLTNEEVKRLRQESDRGYFVLERLQEHARELESRLEEYERMVGRKDELIEQTRQLKRQKEDLECAVWNRVAAVDRIQERVRRGAAFLLEIVESLGKAAAAAKPDIERLIEEKAVEDSYAPALDRWARVLIEVGKTIQNGARDRMHALTLSETVQTRREDARERDGTC